MFNRVTTKLIRKKTFICTIVITISVFSEALGFGMIMPLLSTILNKNGSNAVEDSFFDSFQIFTAFELSIFILAMFVLKTIFGIAKNFLMYDVEWRVRAYWIATIFKLNLVKEYVEFEREKPGVIYNNLINETLKAASFYRQCMEYFAQILQVVALSTVLLLSNAKFAILAFLLASVIIIFVKYTIISRGKKLGVNRQQIEENISHDVNEMIHGMKTVRFFALESVFIKRLDLKLSKIIMLMRKTEVLKRLPLQITEMSLVAVVTILIIIAELFELQLSALLPLLGMMFVVSTKLFNNVGSLATNYMSLKVLNPSMNRVDQLMELYEDNNKIGTTEVQENEMIGEVNEVSFRNVSFGYSETLKVFDELNLCLYKNKITTITGKSGVGKSTLVKLLMRLYSPSLGEIRVNNTDASMISDQKWRSLIGYVDQDAFFFFGSILENLTFGANVYSEEEINRALSLSYCSEFVMDLPSGIETVIGDKGSLLSGGQKARLSLARAIILRPKLLILDEVTSGLDSVTTRKIIESLSAIKDEMIIICITHDQALMKASDDLYKLSSNKLVKLENTS
jgi:ABC-type multidrug transport system fused ATPase/permease subunit